MKYFMVMLAILSVTTARAEAGNYECTGDSSNSLIRVSLNQGEGKLEYIKGNKLLLSLNLPDTAFFGGNPWETDRKYIYFNPGWGESTVNIYVRISKHGSLFDIYATGIVGNVVETFLNYHCVIRG